MELRFGAPTDPAYTRFLDGLRNAAEDLDGNEGWRWHPADSNWYGYPRSEWVLEDLFVPDTAPGFAIQQEWGFPKSTYEVVELYVPDLFGSVGRDYAVHARQYPDANLVWSPWGGGDWRNAFRRNGPVPKPPPPWSRTGGVTLPQRCLQQVKEVEEWERRQVITHAQAQRMINDIVMRCV